MMAAHISYVSNVDVSLAARQYVANGWALVPIDAGSKGPHGAAAAGWNRRDRCVTDVSQCFRVKANVGLAHLYSRTCVIDLDDVIVATRWLASQNIDLSELWNAADAVRISSGRENRGKLLFRLPPGVDSLPTYQRHGDGLELRCATSSGLTTQDVLPPSIHPETKMPYAWDYAEPLIGHWMTPPVLPKAVLHLWLGLARQVALPSGDGDRVIDAKAPLGLGKLEIQKLLGQMDPNVAYQDWLNVGFALHHEMRGADLGLDLWDEWSSTGADYPGTEMLADKWAGFGKRTEAPVVTARSLMQLAGVATIDDFDDITLPPMPGVATVDGVVALPKFYVADADKFAAGRSVGWIIKGFLPRAQLGVIFGESGAGKSFALLDMLMAIARGIDWRGMRVKQQRVVYICAEGQAGFRKRLAAYAVHHQIDLSTIPFGVIYDVPNLLLADDRAIARQIEAWGGADVVSIDTLAQTTPGANENAGDDMGLAINHCKRLSDALRAMIILVHHAGKDVSKGARGWSGIKAAADVEIEVSRAGNTRAMRLTKSKDGEDGKEFGFRLNTIVVELDEDGDDVTSCVVEHCEVVARVEPSPEPKKVKLGKHQERVLGMAKRMSVGCAVIETEALFVACLAEMKSADRSRDAIREAYYSLCDQGYLKADGAYVTVCDPINEQ
jgi:hypothetical protein